MNRLALLSSAAFFPWIAHAQVGLPAGHSATFAKSSAPPACPFAAAGYADGCAEAVAAQTIMPTILNGYAKRAPWDVAGVDYAVGLPTGVVLSPPTSISMAGVTVNSTAHTVTITGNNVTLTAIDYSPNNGWELIINGTNDVVTDSKFVAGSNQGSNGTVLNISSSAVGVTLLNNDVSGGDLAVTAEVGATVMVNNSGTNTIKYNNFHDSGGDMIDFSFGPQVDIVEFNLFSAIGVNTAHADTLQWTNSQISNSPIVFNTVYINVAQPAPGNGALTLTSYGPSATMTTTTVSNNTIAMPAKSNWGTGVYNGDGGTGAGVLFRNMFIDPTGAYMGGGSWVIATGSDGDYLANPTVFSANTNMVSGNPEVVPSSSSKDGSWYVYPDSKGYSPSLSDVYSITASPASGTISAGGTITITANLDLSYTVGGTPPTLSLNTGRVATYLSGSGSNTFEFQYIVQNGDTASALTVTAFNNGG